MMPPIMSAALYSHACKSNGTAVCSHIAACSAPISGLVFSKDVRYPVNDFLTRRIAGSVLLVVYLFATCLSLFNIVTHTIHTLL